MVPSIVKTPPSAAFMQKSRKNGFDDHLRLDLTPTMHTTWNLGDEDGQPKGHEFFRMLWCDATGTSHPGPSLSFLKLDFHENNTVWVLCQ